MAVSTRTRFEVFKRDKFTCRYCGKASPKVVLEVDHIVPIAAGGSDEEMNLATSCWECNRGKAAVPLGEVMTGADPHDEAILLLEKRRQLEEYNALIADERNQRAADHDALVAYWKEVTGMDIFRQDSNWLFGYTLRRYPRELIKEAMDVAERQGRVSTMRYVSAILRKWEDDE